MLKKRALRCQGFEIFGRIAGVIFSPAVTLREVARDPRPAGMIVFVSGVLALSGAIFLSTDVGKLAWLDEAMRQADSFGLPVTDAQYAQLERMRDYAAYLVLVQDLFGVPLVILAVAGILKAVTVVIFDTEATFKQTLGVMGGSTVILALRQLFVLPLNYVRESMTGATNLAIFLPLLRQAGLLARFLGAIDLFVVWWLLVLASGLSALYRRSARSMALALLGLYGVMALGFALTLMFVGGA